LFLEKEAQMDVEISRLQKENEVQRQKVKTLEFENRDLAIN